ncbi:MAG: hypothetical protein PHG23_02430 [Candidatus Pacebacteria bacterium]|nr:hypothetical protein [Candidatus Paceibacterota bacterium]
MSRERVKIFKATSEEEIQGLEGEINKFIESGLVLKTISVSTSFSQPVIGGFSIPAVMVSVLYEPKK